METLDCAYGGLIVYQNLPPDDLGGINSLYSSQYLAQRDTDFLKLYTPTDEHGSQMLYKVYRSAIQQRYWPELVDVRDTTATWLVTCPGPDHDSALTVARIIVALDSRWSIVGLLSFGDFGIVLKGRLPDSQVVDLEHWVFPAALLRIGNPTAQFRERASSSVNQSTEPEVPFNQSNLPSAPAVAEARIINRSASETSRGVTEGPSSSNDNNNNNKDNCDSGHPTPWLQPRTSPSEDDSDDISDDSDDSDSLLSSDSSDEDEEPLPSYSHASRRLARERRLLAQDPSEVEDPAGAALPFHDVVAEEEDFEVPPTYHDRGEGTPDYIEVTGNDGGRDEIHTNAQATHSQEPPPSYLLLPVISEEILPDYETLIELDSPATTTTTTTGQEDSNSSHTPTATLHRSLHGTASPSSASESRSTQNHPHNYGHATASDTLPAYPPANPPTYQPALSPRVLLQTQNQSRSKSE